MQVVNVRKHRPFGSKLSSSLRGRPSTARVVLFTVVAIAVTVLALSPTVEAFTLRPGLGDEGRYTLPVQDVIKLPNDPSEGDGGSAPRPLPDDPVVTPPFVWEPIPVPAPGEGRYTLPVEPPHGSVRLVTRAR